jgi:DNA-binding transcriptional ArsR family regulator
VREERRLAQGRGARLSRLDPVVRAEELRQHGSEDLWRDPVPLALERAERGVRKRVAEPSRHLRVLREAGLVDVRKEAQFRVYNLRPEPLAEVDEWLSPYRSLWESRMNALHTEIARGKRRRVT